MGIGVYYQQAYEAMMALGFIGLLVIVALIGMGHVAWETWGPKKEDSTGGESEIEIEVSASIEIGFDKEVEVVKE